MLPADAMRQLFRTDGGAALDVLVTRQAADPEAGDVVLVAERNRLAAVVVGPPRPVGPWTQPPQAGAAAFAAGAAGLAVAVAAV